MIENCWRLYKFVDSVSYLMTRDFIINSIYKTVQPPNNIPPVTKLDNRFNTHVIDLRMHDSK